MKIPLLAALALCLASDPTIAAGVEDPWLTEFSWSAKPSGEDMAKHYPSRASAQERGGWALLSCRIGRHGRLMGCKVAAEGPEGYSFGEAALKTASKFRMKTTDDGQSVEGRRVRIPIAWHMPGDPGPPKTWPAGEPSMLVTIAPAKTGRLHTFSCPSSSDADRQCLAHSLTWEKRPELEEIAALVRKAGDTASAIECSVTAEGSLEKCKVDNTSAAIGEGELLSLTKLFMAPPLTHDGTPTVGQRVLLTFDWKALRRTLEVFEAT